MISNVKRTPVFAALLLALSVTFGCDSNDNAISVVDTGVTEDSNNTGGVSTGDGTAVTTDEGTTVGTGEGSGEGSSGGTGAEPDSTENTPATGDPDVPDSQPGAELEAVYSVRFVATWSEETHPTNFPADPHFSPLTGAVHNEQVIIWERGQNASDGIEEMAETGGTTPLLAEIQSAIDQGYASSSIEGGGIQVSPGSTEVDFVVSRDYPLVTLVSMLAPSPDWFVGVNSRSMIDDNGEFVDSLTVYLNLYDSGTDGGERFTSPDMDIPRSPIGLVNSFPFDSDFFEGRPHAGTLVFTRQR